MDYKFSVAIPTFNRAEYLREALDSVLHQSYPPTEVIVVDDGSTDHTEQVLADYKNRIKTLRIENSGAAIARKTAAEATSCPWLAFCDSDDVWLPEHLERRVSLLKKYPDSNFSFSNLEAFGPAAMENRTYFQDAPVGWWEQFPIKEDNCIIFGRDAYRPFLRYNPASPVTTVMSRDLYDKIDGIDPRYSRMVAEDADMARKAALHGITVCDLTVTARQRRHEGNQSSQVLLNILGKQNILRNHIDFNIAPAELHHAILEEIESTSIEAFEAAYYSNTFYTALELANSFGIRKLSIKNKLRYVLMRIKNYL